jgi:hypothetical protein
MKDMEALRKQMAGKDEKERALNAENNELKSRVVQLEEELTHMFAALKLMKVQTSDSAKSSPTPRSKLQRLGHRSAKLTCNTSPGSSCSLSLKSARLKLQSNSSVTSVT